MTLFNRRLTLHPWYAWLLCAWAFLALVASCARSFPDGQAPLSEEFFAVAIGAINGLTLPSFQSIFWFLIFWSPLIALPFGITKPALPGE